MDLMKAVTFQESFQSESRSAGVVPARRNRQRLKNPHERPDVSDEWCIDAISVA